MPATGLRRWGVEAALAALACVVFLACLGSLELWGKREQRLAAEVLDTVENGRWLVATIQGRPRLEKPPLPRWATAALATAVGRCDELVVRLPGAIAALGTLALTYLLGLRLGGRPLGLASAIILATTPLFIAEARQAGQDVPLAFFTTLAIYAAVRFLEVGRPDLRRWAIAFHVAIGLGFLCKGPVILAIVAAAIVPWATLAGLGRRLAHLMFDPIGLPIAAALMLGWPLAAWRADPNAAGVWAAEIGQKTGALPIVHRARASFLLQWPTLVLPWVVAGAMGLALPFRRDADPRTWLAWSWSAGVALLLGLWAVAKPNYYVPCLPGFALLAGAAWIRLDRRAESGDRRAQSLMDLQWGIWAVGGAGALAMTGRALGTPNLSWCAVMSGAAAGAGLAGAIATRRGRGVLAMAPTLFATAVAVVVGYGIVAPAANPTRGHATIARAIDRAVPPEVVTLDFFHELDEGLWFYLRNRGLAAVAGSQARYNDAFDGVSADAPPARLTVRSKRVLADWLRDDDRGGSYLLIRDKVYDVLAADLAGFAEPILRETLARRNGLVLLKVAPAPRSVAVREPR